MLSRLYMTLQRYSFQHVYSNDKADVRVWNVWVISMLLPPTGADIKQVIEVRWGSHWTWMSCMRDQWSGRSQQRGMEGWQLCHGNLQPVSVSVGAQFTLPSLNLTDAACYVCKCQYMCSSEVHVVYKSWSNKRFLVYLKCKPFFFFTLLV